MKEHELLIRPDDAILVVDITYAFLKGGGLPVPGGDDIVLPAARVVGLFQERRRYMVIDSHPMGHISLASSYEGQQPFSTIDMKTARRWFENPSECRIGAKARFTASDLYAYLFKVKAQVLWPDHAIVGTRQAEQHDSLKQIEFGGLTLNKGMQPDRDSYSAFRDNYAYMTGMGEKMMIDGIKRVFVCGLALDYCVGWSALDSAAYGFETYVLEDLTRGIAADTIAKMKTDLARAGVKLISSESLVFP
jgi:nicotinamidase/pyrazinamidase